MLDSTVAWIFVASLLRPFAGGLADGGRGATKP